MTKDARAFLDALQIEVDQIVEALKRDQEIFRRMHAAWWGLPMHKRRLANMTGRMPEGFEDWKNYGIPKYKTTPQFKRSES